jgi:hypothetical protein
VATTLVGWRVIATPANGVEPTGPGSAPLNVTSDPLAVDVTTDGTARPPKRSRNQSPAATAVPRGKLAAGDYRRSGLVPNSSVPRDHQPYWGATTPRVDARIHDATGVRMFGLKGHLYNHPEGQAAYGLENLSTYVSSHDAFYLVRALAQAQRLVDTKVVSGDGWYFPYQFDFALHSMPSELMSAPWYSAMAQGQALSLFSRLATVTGDAKWRTAADATYASLTQTVAAGAPWVVHVDPTGYLWLEEYPRTPVTASDFTYNGHMFATFGLYDYWLLTRSDAVAQLFDGAASTVLAYARTFRTTNWQSRYCLQHRVDADKYHQIHVLQLIDLQALTGDHRFAQYADAFRDDYPKKAVAGSVRLARGTWTAYQFDAKGTVTGSRALTLTRASSTTGDLRARIKGHGIYTHITAGTLSGYWLAERYGTAYMQVKAAENIYWPNRRVAFRAGAYTGYSFDDQARVSGSLTKTFASASVAHTDRSAYINARRYLRVVDGVFAGRWIVAGTVVVS